MSQIQSAAIGPLPGGVERLAGKKRKEGRRMVKKWNELQREYSTPIKPKASKGGLVVCGIEWGGDPTVEGKLWKPTSFATQAGMGQDFRFQRNLLKWFRIWGCDLGEAGPKLDAKISHTNFFMNQDIRAGTKRKKDYEDCFSELVDRITPLSPVGLVICGWQKSSFKSLERGITHAAKKAYSEGRKRDWGAVIGGPNAVRRRIIDVDRFHLEMLDCQSPAIVFMTHPSASVPDASVRKGKRLMGRWLKDNFLAGG